MPEVAAQMPTVDLCLGVSTFRPGNAAVAQIELNKRGVDCRDHAQAVYLLQQQRAQQQAQREAVILQQLVNQPAYRPYQIPAPPVMQPPRQTYCTSQWIDGQLQTVCR